MNIQLPKKTNLSDPGAQVHITLQRFGHTVWDITIWALAARDVISLPGAILVEVTNTTVRYTSPDEVLTIETVENRHG